MSDEILPWQRTGRKQLADCRIFTVDEVRALSPGSGKEHGFYVIETGDWVNIVPLTADNEVVCIRQYRHGSDEITLEIPGGMLDMGEQPDQAAMRECLEETGYQVSQAQSLGVISPNPAVFPNRLHTFLARDAIKVGDVSNTATEETQVVLIPLSEMEEQMVSGRIDHALVVATLWRLLYLLREGSIHS